MNSRKYPRTLNEAFNRTVEYGCAIERPMPRAKFWSRVFSLAIACCWIYTMIVVFKLLEMLG